MNKNLLILGAGAYGISAMEVAKSMNCFKKIDFLDDSAKELSLGIKVLDYIENYQEYAGEYGNIFVAMEKAEVKLKLLEEIRETTPYNIATLVSPSAYISPTAQIMQGTIIEPMAVINTGAIVGTGCIVGAGSVVDRSSMCCDGAHLGCNATIVNNTLVPAGIFIGGGETFRGDAVNVKDLFPGN